MARSSRLAASVVAIALALPSLGCPKRPSAESIATSPDLAEETGQAKCGVRSSAAKPLVVEWPAADRAALEARASRALVVVRYEGCEMEVLTNCSALGTYGYLGLNQKRESVRIHNADELYAQLPVGAAGLEAKLERAGQLNVDMVIIGRKESDRGKFTERDLDGRCDEATHVITGLTVGAFSFYAGASAAVGAGVKVGNIGAGAETEHGREVLKEDGDADSCAEAEQGAEAPPDGCGALLRVEVVPIDRIFGESRPIGTAATTPGTPPTTSGVQPSDAVMPPSTDPKLDRKIAVWRGITFGSYGLALAGLGVLLGGQIMKSRASTTLSNLMTDNGGTLPAGSAERQEAIRKGNTGAALLIVGASATGLFAILGLVGQLRLKTLQTQKARGTVVIRPTIFGAEMHF